MQVDEFWDYTPRLFQLKLEGKSRADFELQKAEWQRMRYQTVCLINKDRKRKDQLKLRDLLHFDWEKKLAKKSSKSEYKKAMYLIAKSNRSKG